MQHTVSTIKTVERTGSKNAAPNVNRKLGNRTPRPTYPIRQLVMTETTSVLTKADGIGEEAVYRTASGLKPSSRAGRADTKLLTKLVGNVSPLLTEPVIKVVNTGTVKLNNMLLKDRDS